MGKFCSGRNHRHIGNISGHVDRCVRIRGNGHINPETKLRCALPDRICLAAQRLAETRFRCEHQVTTFYVQHHRIHRCLLNQWRESEGEIDQRLRRGILTSVVFRDTLAINTGKHRFPGGNFRIQTCPKITEYPRRLSRMAYAVVAWVLNLAFGAQAMGFRWLISKPLPQSRSEWVKGVSSLSGCCPSLLTSTSRVSADGFGLSTFNAGGVSKAFMVHDHARELFFSSKLNEAQERTQAV